MNANQIYNLPPVRVSSDIYRIEDWFPQVDFYRIETQSHSDIKLHEYANHSNDGERVWYMGSLWYKDVPFMICQCAGRGGQDYKDSFVTNRDVYDDFVKFLFSLQQSDGNDIVVIDPLEDMPGLTSFYNGTLSMFYDPNLTPSYKVGDLVVVEVEEDHMRDMYVRDKKYILAYVLIDHVEPMNPLKTYSGWQQHRQVRAHFNEKQVSYLERRAEDNG